MKSKSVQPKVLNDSNLLTSITNYLDGKSLEVTPTVNKKFSHAVNLTWRAKLLQHHQLANTRMGDKEKSSVSANQANYLKEFKTAMKTVSDDKNIQRDVTHLYTKGISQLSAQAKSCERLAVVTNCLSMSVANIAYQLKRQSLLDEVYHKGLANFKEKNGVCRNDWGMTPLSWAIRCGQREVVQSILAQSPNQINMIDLNKQQSTPLYIAMLLQDQEIIDSLIEKGADVKATTTSGATPFHVAVRVGNDAMFNRLLANGVDINGSCLSPLWLAIKSNRDDFVTQLLAKGANVNEGCVKEGLTPLHEAVDHGKDHIVAQLLSKGANVNATATVAGGVTPLHLAVEEGNHQIAAQLLAKGANVNARADGEIVALHLAVLHSNNSMVIQLLAAEAKVDVRNSVDGTALLYAAYKNAPDMVLTLLLAGADPSVVCGNQTAFECTQSDEIKMLILSAQLHQWINKQNKSSSLFADGVVAAKQLLAQKLNPKGIKREKLPKDLQVLFDRATKLYPKTLTEKVRSLLS